MHDKLSTGLKFTKNLYNQEQSQDFEIKGDGMQFANKDKSSGREGGLVGNDKMLGFDNGKHGLIDSGLLSSKRTFGINPSKPDAATRTPFVSDRATQKSGLQRHVHYVPSNDDEKPTDLRTVF